MIREWLSKLSQEKFFLMIITALVYILGLVSFFCDKSFIFSLLITIISIILVLKNYISPKLVVFWYLIFFFAFFNASIRIKNADDLYNLAPKETVIYGQIVSIPDSGLSGRERFFFNVKKVKYNEQTKVSNSKTFVSIYNIQKNSDLIVGNYYQIKGNLRTPFKVSNPSQFDYGKYLKNFNTYTVFYAQAQDCILADGEISFRWKFIQNLNKLRNEILNTHSKYLKSPNIEILGGIVFGDDAVSPPDYIKKSFINSGLLHILAASGMNVALIYGIWFFILNKLRVPYRLTISSGIFVIILYTLMTGLGPSVIRASIMLIFILFGKLIDRDAHSLSLLSFVAILMLVYNPSYINDVGFQLSFIVTFGLLFMSEPLYNRLGIIPKWLSGAICIPLIAQLWVAPIQMYYFNSFSLYSIIANALILPFLTVISFGGFISSVLALIKPIASFVCMGFDFVLNPFIDMLVLISNYFSSLSNSLIQMSQPKFIQIFLYYLSLIILTVILRKGLSKKLLCSFISVFLLIFLLGFNFAKNLEFIAFDVQNADSFLLKMDSKYYIIDSGKLGYKGSKSQVNYIMLEYLKDNGIKDIEGLIITHFDSDHAGGALDLLENLNINKIYVNSLADKSNIAQNLYKKYPQKIHLVHNNQKIFEKNNLRITFYCANLKDEKNENENSIITLITQDDFDILMMGDAGIVAFEKIKNYLPKKIEVLKVGHHGAKDVVSKQMLSHLSADYAIISTGKNIYGHPNSITLELLESYKIKTFRTDRDNSIKIQNKKIYAYSRENGYKLVN